MSGLLTPSDTQKKTVLVTGASGFIGRALVQRLLDRQYQVQVLSRHPDEEGPDASDCRQFTGDICDEEILRQACSGVETVFHLAAYAHVNQHDETQMRAVNVDGTRELLAAAIASGVKRIVFFSSSLADAQSNAVMTSYGRAKRDAEELLLAAANAGQIEVCCLRPVNVYGPGMKGNLLTLIRLISKGVFPSLPVPSATLSLVGHRDLCEAALLAAESSRANGQTYTVTDGRTYTMKGVEITVRKALGKSALRWQTPLPLLWAGAAVLEVLGRVLRMKNAPGLRSYRVLTTDNVFSCEKIQNELGYNPAATFTDELPGILQQLRSEKQKARD
ncbi:MAG: SDR family NAD(P)-dependent oxidoreductase [Gammaproteobacteria bacterium]|nr:SDR family NAD(P)-dependent oxidoreductase [Gammaproteobacteria bacterium]MDP2139750.1 SDR family NAD(P)-dependent oxidoreductase [Gammaproteobacteria bacterium]MDP2348952.1 SDR family NAD(P)-dependent oxidoreductase [Gammaproteobacteria bacterium]